MFVSLISFDEGDVRIGGLLEARLPAHVGRALVRRQAHAPRLGKSGHAQRHRAARLRALDRERASIPQWLGKRDLLCSTQERGDAPKRSLNRAASEKNALVGGVGE